MKRWHTGAERRVREIERERVNAVQKACPWLGNETKAKQKQNENKWNNN